MRERLFVDTLFVVARINIRDQYHQQAVEVSQRYADWPLITTEAVLFEIGNALSHGFKAEGIATIEAFQNSKNVNVVQLTHRLFSRAFDMYKSYHDKAWGLVDCLSFVVMRDEGVTKALTFDRHFKQAGFTALMREDP